MTKYSARLVVGTMATICLMWAANVHAQGEPEAFAAIVDASGEYTAADETYQTVLGDLNEATSRFDSVLFDLQTLPWGTLDPWLEEVVDGLGQAGANDISSATFLLHYDDPNTSEPSCALQYIESGNELIEDAIDAYQAEAWGAAIDAAGLSYSRCQTGAEICVDVWFDQVSDLNAIADALEEIWDGLGLYE